MNYNRITESAEDFVRGFLKEHQNPKFLYHRIVHIENVVAAAIRIAHHYKLSERDRFICTVAAWFHDIGYYGDMSNHEEAGAKKAKEFLENNGVDEETILEVKKCILATRLPQSPISLLQEIVCDADLFHLGTNDFPSQNELMRQETEALHNLRINKGDWDKGTVLLMQNHRYHTKYCKELLNKKKKQNLEKLRNKAGQVPVVINPVNALVNEYQANGHLNDEEDKSRNCQTREQVPCFALDMVSANV
jgi:predicted metal-dependent HD superfamily phosphohydrolase